MRLFKIVFFNVLIFSVGCLVVEMFFGNWLRPDNFDLLNVPRDVDWYFEANELYPDVSNTPIHYHRDHYGLRGAYPDPSSIDILTLGGSTTDQRFLTEGKTWQDIVADNFKKDGRDVSIVNAGLDGQSSVGHIANFDFWFQHIPRLKAKYVMVYLGVNDANMINPSGIDYVVERSGIKGMIKSRSVLFHLYRTLRGFVQSRFSIFPVAHTKVDFAQFKNWLMMPLQPDPRWQQWYAATYLETYKARLKVLDQKIRAFGAQPIWVTQRSCAFRYKHGVLYHLETHHGIDTDSIEYYYMLSATNRVTMEFCAQTGGICIDLAEELDFDSESGDFYDWFHTTPRGAVTVGNYLYEQLGSKIGFERVSSKKTFR